MDYDKEAREATKIAFTKSEEYAKDSSVEWFIAGAKRAEELLLGDPMIVDLRKVWEEIPFGFNFLNISYQDNANNSLMTVKILPRPKPAWVPKVGDKVCALNTKTGDIIYGIFVREDRQGNYHMSVNGGEVVYAEKKYMKPASMENIGKRWEDI